MSGDSAVNDGDADAGAIQTQTAMPRYQLRPRSQTLGEAVIFTGRSGVM
jgi:hypothetical protein